jgi:1,4-alpha-glucan branching enzyme
VKPTQLSRLTVLCFVLLLCVAIPIADATEVTFQFIPPTGTIAVSVAGTFNDWNTKANPMADPDDDGVWEVTVDLPAGSHQYKFVVNGGQWLTNESAEEFTDDGFGGKNSVITVGSEPVAVLGTNAATGTVAAPTDTDTPVRFRFRPTGEVHTVTVAGTFNDWSNVATPMVDTDGDGVWEITLRTEHGTHQYKFVVNGTEWLADEHAAEFMDDGFGGQNSVMQVGREAMVVGEPGGAAPGATDSGTEVTFRHKPEAKHVNSVSVAGSFNEWNAAANPMQDKDGDGLWEITLRLAPGRYTYQFVVGGDTWFTDKTATEFEADGFGGKNAVLTVITDPVVVGEADR